MKNKVIIGMMLLLLINTVMTGFLVAKVVVGDKQINLQVIPGVSSQKERGKAIQVEIWIDEENNIHRTGVGNDVDSLHWEIIYNGERVLSRNALNETVYQYFRSDPGTYTIYVKSFVDGSYKIVSNVISYSIE